MGLTQLLVPFLATWFGIHAFLFLLQRFLNRPNLPVGPGSGTEYELLPTSVSAASTSGGQSSNVKPKTPSSALLVKPFYVRFSTTGLNSFFFRLGNSPRLARFWRVWYGLGVAFGMLAMVLGWALLLFAGFKLLFLAITPLLSLWRLGSWESGHQQQQQQHQKDQGSVNPSRFRKRDLAVDTGATPSVHGGSSEDDMVFIPVIPGVTFPISHLPYYLLALLVSGVIHEAGHAIAAAREKTQVSSTGIFLYILYPGAFVDISSRAMAIMTPIQQLRVICAGVWHNAVLFGLSWIFLASGALQLLFQVFGWIQMDDGLSVVDVAQQSALRQLLKPGYVIRQLDDISLKGDPLGTWLKTLSPQTIPDSETLLAQQESGFCIPDTLMFVWAMGIYDDEDEDEDFEVSTPRSIRIRNAIPPKARSKRPTYRSEQQQQRSQTQEQKQQQQRQRLQSELPSSQKQHVQEQSHDPQQQTLSQPNVINESSSTRPRNGSSLSLRRPAPKRDVVVQQRTATPPELEKDKRNAASAGVIVLDSESEGHSDIDASQTRQSPLADLDLLVTQFGGVSPASTPTKKRSDSQRTDDHLLYSQGDDTEGAVAGHGEEYETSWSISPQTTNPFLADLVATVEPMRSTSSPGSQQHQDDITIFSFDSKLTSDCSSTMQTGELDARTLESDAFSLETESDQIGQETLECVICGKSLAHLDQARIEYHINNCMDEQQEEQQTIGSLDLESTVPPVSSSQGQFAGAQVDYLTRVMRCPICKLDWPLKSKSKAGTTATTTQPRKAKQKVEHMKRCAKVHKRTVQSVLYQLRLLRERYERSIMLGTSMDSDPAETSQEMMDEATEDQKDEREDTPTDNVERLEVRKPKARVDTIAQRQVVSLADNADTDFASDAIITTVQTRVAPTKPKLTKVQRMEEDQQDDGLQLALAISMSMQSGGSDTPHMSSLEYGATSTTWSMAPLSKTGARRGDKRRKLTNKNETTILPVAEVQQLIQANVDALLFPETDCSCDGPSSNAGDQCLGCGKEGRPMKTPPWRPSRFTAMTSTDLQVSLSQSSLPDTASLPSKSLWDLSHLDDRDVDSLDLCTPPHRDASGQQSISESLGVSRIDSNDNNSSNSPTEAAVFDSEQYVARFLKQIHMRNHNNTMRGMSAKSASTFDSEDYSVAVGGSGSNQLDSKFSSPLWSASKTRRISFKDHMKLNEDTFSNALKSEIIDHLKLMEQNIQRAKRTTYLKIMESLRRHPIAARLGDLEPKDPIILEDEDGPGSSDESIQDPDGYQEPLSPLLRFSRASEANRPLSPTTNELYSPQSNEGVSLEGSGIRDYSQGQDEREHGDMSMNPIPDDQQYGDNDLDQNHSGIMVYSPPVLSQAISSTSVDVDVMPSGDVSFRSEGTPVTSSLFSSPGDLPPPLDFAKLGYHSAASVSNLKSTALTQPVSSPASSSLPHWSLSVQLSETNDGELESHLAGEGSPSNWANITTPKRNKRHLSGNEHIGFDVGDDTSPAWMPGRPRSARKTRTIPFMPLSQPEPLRQQEPRQPPKRNVLDGLPLLKAPVVRTPSASESGADRDKGHNDGDMDFVQDVYPSSQPATILSSQATNMDNNRGSVMVDVQDFGMAARNNHLVNGAGSGSRTPSNRKKTRAVLRAEAFVAETAKAVANIKAQKQMPDYARMTVPRLRLVATTFGLKGGNKGLLVEQLTSIWQKLHPDKSSDDVDEEEEGVGGGGNGGRDVEANHARSKLLSDQDIDGIGPSIATRHGREGIVNDNDPGQCPEDNTVVSEDEDDEEDDLSPSQVGLGGDGDDDDDNEDPSLPQQRPAKMTPILERQLFKFLNSTPHLRKQFLSYKASLFLCLPKKPASTPVLSGHENQRVKFCGILSQHLDDDGFLKQEDVAAQV
ncbi:Membrane-bound transcription factor site-2 protease [Mortierella polycephala]|uniref:Endopeptidase S2P n=1 Tax=Mortierella polycephala TaxID=41804 RepID=A0A9P6TX27_9FUNG|nr:Membrane-bound transcription factor site-2 protease [Mortierella polycephala]